MELDTSAPMMFVMNGDSLCADNLPSFTVMLTPLNDPAESQVYAPSIAAVSLDIQRHNS